MVEPRVDLSVDLAGIRLANPVLTASGTFGYGEEFSSFLDLNRLGGLVTKGLSPKPREGNPPPRIIETPSGMLNAIGLQNVGVERFIAEKLPVLRRYRTAVIANVFGETIEEYRAVCQALDGAEGVHGLELNVSCPNTESGGMTFGTDPVALAEVTAAAREITRLPLMVKLTPNVTDIAGMARVAVEAGADALSLVNTFTGMTVDVERRRPTLANLRGGLSGPAIRPLALYLLHEVRQAVDVPLVGIGGIASLDDMLQFLITGASAVQVGTANYVEPGIAVRLVEELEAWCAERGVAGVGELVGTLEVPG
jgi:dihydroorotate dehydrogenase (NAD+) catalytic subunit